MAAKLAACRIGCKERDIRSRDQVLKAPVSTKMKNSQGHFYLKY